MMNFQLAIPKGNIVKEKYFFAGLCAPSFYFFREIHYQSGKR